MKPRVPNAQPDGAGTCAPRPASRLTEKQIARLSVYRRLLQDLPANAHPEIHSHDLAAISRNTAAQIRRDLMDIGFTGSSARGYRIEQLVESIGRILDAPDGQTAALCGVGNLGRALLDYFTIWRPQLRIVAAFDTDPDKTGRVIHRCRVWPLSELDEVVRAQGITVGVITVPAVAAQRVAESMLGRRYPRLPQLRAHAPAPARGRLCRGDGHHHLDGKGRVLRADRAGRAAGGVMSETVGTIEDPLGRVLAHWPLAERDALIPILQEVQESCGYLPRRSPACAIGRHLDLPASKVYGVATFYNQFRFQPPGRLPHPGLPGHGLPREGLGRGARGAVPASEDPAGADDDATACSAWRSWPASAPAGWRRSSRSTASSTRGWPRRPRQRSSRRPASRRRSMAETAFTRCCRRCWHSPELPCPEIVACRTEGPLCHDDSVCAAHLCAATDPYTDQPRIRVGTGTCGLGAGAGRTLAAVQDWLGAHDVRAHVSEVGCIGYCVGEPLLDVELPGRTRVVWQHATADRVPALLQAALDGAPSPEDLLGQIRDQGRTPWSGVPFLDEHPFFAPQTRWVLANCGHVDPDSLNEYVARGGYRALAKVLATRTPQEVVQEVLDSGLRGRGGGGFPTGRKWALALSAPAEQRYLICNADEGDPGAFMDRAVIEGDPHRLLEGMALAAYAIGAQKAYVYIRAEYPLAVRRLHTAIAAARGYGLLGRNILDSGFNLDIRVKMGAGAFVCGEETALIQSIEGKRGMPRPRPPFPVGARTVRQADRDQQRRDAGQRARHPGPRRRLVQRPRHRDQQGHEGLRPVRHGGAHGPGRSGDGHDHPRDRLRDRRRHPGRTGLQGRADRRAIGRVHPRAAPRYAGRLRVAARRSAP